MDEEEERKLLASSLNVLTEITGKRPLGYRSPAWDLSANTITLLEEQGLIYDSSLMAYDYQPHFARIGDEVSEDIFIPGQPSAVLEFPVAWELDDYPYFQFTPRPLYQGLRLPEDVYKAWAAEFDCAHEESGVFTLTCHPEIIGRGPRIKMLEKLIRYMKANENVVFKTMGDAAIAQRAI
jgi:peptidoglycan/xylan/chitin deacetylase (PgdA/CDA1 family)